MLFLGISVYSGQRPHDKYVYTHFYLIFVLFVGLIEKLALSRYQAKSTVTKLGSHPIQTIFGVACNTDRSEQSRTCSATKARSGTGRSTY